MTGKTGRYFSEHLHHLPSRNVKLSKLAVEISLSNSIEVATTWLSKEVRDEQLPSLLYSFRYYHPKSTSTIHPGPRKEGRKTRKEGRNHPGLQFRNKCLLLKNSPNKKSNITPKTSNPTQNPPMLGSFHSK